MNQSISHQSATTQGKQPLYQDVEANIREALFAGDHDDGCNEPYQRDPESGEEPKSPDLWIGELGLMIMVMVVVISAGKGTNSEEKHGAEMELHGIN